MLNLPDVILTHIYSFLSKREISRCNITVHLTRVINKYMPKLNRRLLAHLQLQVRTSLPSGTHLGKVIIRGDFMYIGSEPIIQIRSLPDMTILHKVKTNNAVYEIVSTTSYVYYLDRDSFGRSCHVYRMNLLIPHIEESRVLIFDMNLERLFAHGDDIYSTYREYVFKLVDSQFIPFISLSSGSSIVYFDVRSTLCRTDCIITTHCSVYVYDGCTLVQIMRIGHINADYGNTFRRGLFLRHQHGVLTNKGLMILDTNAITFIPNCVSVIQFQDFIVCFITTNINATYPRLSSLRFYYAHDLTEFTEVNYTDNSFSHTSVFKTQDDSMFGFISGRHIKVF